jgi:Lanthionine synthetase C-like protein
VLHDPARHEPIRPIDWDEDRVRATIEQIVNDTELRFSPDRYWPVHLRDLEGDDDPNRCATSLYYGACGVMWALHYLQAAGAAQLSRSYTVYLEDVLIKNRAWLRSFGRDESASYMMGDTPILMLAYGHSPGAELADRLATLIAGNLLTAAGEAVWAAGPLAKGSNLCHGTGGNGYAFLKLFQRTGQPHWLDRARAFAIANEWRGPHPNPSPRGRGVNFGYQLTTAVYSSAALPSPGTGTCQTAEPALSFTCCWVSEVIFQSPCSGSRTVTVTGLESALRNSIR